ncbi:MAG: hypothetical protein K1X88_31485 [Nannocystaceae bacterium]|nr:hypothetical protein [Nannocystaceae bacterium]
MAGASADSGGAVGCTKVDFLFVIDNSGSMAEEQANLIASFPAFVDAIEASVAVDFHIAIVDTDASFAVEQCDEICPANPEDTCVACADEAEEVCTYLPCDSFPPVAECLDTLGSSRVTDPVGGDCGSVGAQRFFTDAQTDLSGTFACAARVGTGASGERPADAMTEALGAQAGDDGCNAGFLRDDALLVVTMITDEDDSDTDDGVVSTGDPEQWHQRVVAAKNGDEDAVVFLGLLSDVDLEGGTCPDVDPAVAAPAPRLRALAESFTRGTWGSVCSGDYGPFFADSIAIIDTACTDFEPAG